MNYNFLNKLKVSVFKQNYTTLYRSVGETEFLLIERTNFNSFPARLPGQPFFYPVCNLTYANEIAVWNSKDPFSQFAGYVLEFKILNKYLNKYIQHVVGSFHHKEYWIPSNDLSEFNKNIVGKIHLLYSMKTQ